MSAAVKTETKSRVHITIRVHIYKYREINFVVFSTSNSNNVELVNRGRHHLTRHMIHTYMSGDMNPKLLLKFPYSKKSTSLVPEPR